MFLMARKEISTLYIYLLIGEKIILRQNYKFFTGVFKSFFRFCQGIKNMKIK